MAYQGSDPEVTAWMREHPDVVDRVEKIYGALRGKDFTELLQFAYDVGVDVAKHEEQAKGRLIIDIVKTSSEKALAILEGQGVLLPVRGGSSNKRG